MQCLACWVHGRVKTKGRGKHLEVVSTKIQFPLLLQQ